MRGERLTLGLVLVAVGLVAGVPVLREGLTGVVQGLVPGGGLRGMPGAADLEAVARAHPDDAQVWLAYAMAADGTLASAHALSELGKAGAAGQTEPVPDAAAEEAWDKALQLGGNSPAALLHAAGHYMAGAGELRESGEVGPQPSAPGLAAQARSRGKARALLLRCRRCAPDNAAPDYGLAWVGLAGGNRAQALAALRSASLKPHWDTYQPEAGLAMLRLVEGLHLPPGLRGSAAQALLSSAAFPPLAQLRSMARVVVAMGDGARGRGDHAEALACYGSMLHLGSIMRTDARTIIDGLVGIAVSAISTGSVLPKADLDRISAQARGGDERVRLTWEARTTAFAVFARAHGRDDLARLAEDEMVQGRQWKQDARTVTGRMGREPVYQMVTHGALQSLAVWLTAVVLLGLAAVVGLWSLALQYWREPRLPAPSRYWGWLGLVLVLVVPGQLAARVMAWIVAHSAYYDLIEKPALWVAAVGSGPLLWLLIVLVLALRRRARLPVEARTDRTRSYLGALRALLPPTLAALVLLSVIGLAPVQRMSQALDDEQHAIMQQGEVQYYGIGTGKVSSPPVDN